MKINPYLFLVFFYLLGACRDKIAPIPTGEYGNSLHICTENDGHFFAYYYPNPMDKSLYLTMTGMPYQPIGNVIIWKGNARDTVVYGEVIWKQMSQTLSFSFLDSLTLGGMAWKLKQEFKLTNAKTTWQKLYDFDSADSCYIYKVPTYSSPKISVSYHSPLYGVETRADWAKITTDSGDYWLPIMAVRH